MGELMQALVEHCTGLMLRIRKQRSLNQGRKESSTSKVVFEKNNFSYIDRIVNPEKQSLETHAATDQPTAADPRRN